MVQNYRSASDALQELSPRILHISRFGNITYQTAGLSLLEQSWRIFNNADVQFQRPVGGAVEYLY